MAEHAPHHQLSVDHRIGPLHLRVQLDFAAPWTVVFGPSGSGKSSLLRAMCGLLPDRAHATFLACRVQPPADLSQTPPYRRNLAYAPQGAVLFPHLTVRENIAFATSAGMEYLLDLFALTALADRRPGELSGGERQRVNLARAFAVPQPRLMLLDEPFTGLDRALRDRLLPRLQQHLAARGIPAVSVTHDIEEALLLNAEVVRLEAGKVIAQGPAEQVLAGERAQALRILNPANS